MTDTAELATEQKYFDKAWEARERQREELSHARDGAALQRGAQIGVQKAAKAYAGKLGEPDEAVAYGRFDLDGQAYYIGKHAISDEQRPTSRTEQSAGARRPERTRPSAAPPGRS